MANLKERLPTRSAASEILEQPSPEQTLLSRTQELQSSIAALKEELSETRKLNQTFTAENRKLVRENADLRDELVTQKRRLMEAEQTIRDIKDENDKLRDVEDIACIEAVRRARMEMLIIRNGAKRGADRQREEYEAEIEKLSDDCRRQIDAARREIEAAKAHVKTVERVLLLVASYLILRIQ